MNGLFAYPADIAIDGSARCYLLFQVICKDNEETRLVPLPTAWEVEPAFP